MDLEIEKALHQVFAEILTLQLAVTTFHNDLGRWPENLEELTKFVQSYGLETEFRFDAQRYRWMTFSERTDGTLVVRFERGEDGAKGHFAFKGWKYEDLDELPPIQTFVGIINGMVRNGDVKGAQRAMLFVDPIVAANREAMEDQPRYLAVRDDGGTLRLLGARGIEHDAQRDIMAPGFDDRVNATPALRRQSARFSTRYNRHLAEKMSERRTNANFTHDKIP